MMDATEKAEIYQFSNGVQVYRRHVLDHQVRRYLSEGNQNLHEPEEEHWFAHLLEHYGSETPLFYDIGCGIGYYTLLLLHLKPRAQAVTIEALPEHIAAIRENFQLNDVDSQVVHMMNWAAHICNGEVRFSVGDFSSHVIAENSQIEANELVVPARDIAEVLEQETRQVDLAKLDVQGAEFALLNRIVEGQQTHKVKNWIVGTHSDTLHDNCLELISKYWKILHQDPAPPFQPDGLIVATSC